MLLQLQSGIWECNRLQKLIWATLFLLNLNFLYLDIFQGSADQQPLLLCLQEVHQEIKTLDKCLVWFESKLNEEKENYDYDNKCFMPLPIV